MRQWLKRLWCVMWTCAPDGTTIQRTPAWAGWGGQWNRRMHWSRCLRCGHVVRLLKVAEGLYEVNP